MSQTFYITIRPVDDALPVVQIPGMRVQEGVRKTITEFELKATDADTEVSIKSGNKPALSQLASSLLGESYTSCLLLFTISR